LLAREGFFQELYPGLDVSTVLKNHEGFDLQLVDVKIGGQTGKAWWFKHPEQIEKKGVPLSERVEQCVLRELLGKRRVTFTDVWRRVGEDFPNSLTPDALSIREVLRDYARESGQGEWQVLPKLKEREREHDTMIWLLARIGKALGYKIWIGRNEQAHIIQAKEDGPLSTVVDADLSKCYKGTVEGTRSVSDIDLLWTQASSIVCAFEVEYSTTITSAVERGSHLPKEVKRYIVLPEERIPKLKRKMESSFFRQGMLEQGWEVLLFDKIFDNRDKLLQDKMRLESTRWDYTSDPSLRDFGQLTLV